MILNIARFDAFQASTEIRSIKDEALASGKGLPSDPSRWNRYKLAKARARLALTMIAIVKTWIDAHGTTLIPAKLEFAKFLRAQKNWRRRHALRGKERSTRMSAYRRLVKIQNRLQRGDTRYDAVEAWAEARLMEAKKRSARAL